MRASDTPDTPDTQGLQDTRDAQRRLQALTEEVRDALVAAFGSLEGRCETGARLLCALLEREGHEPLFVFGVASGDAHERPLDHCWARLGDTLLDPTFGQFQGDHSCLVAVESSLPAYRAPKRRRKDSGDAEPFCEPSGQREAKRELERVARYTRDRFAVDTLRDRLAL